jgi:hypothetical protein
MTEVILWSLAGATLIMLVGALIEWAEKKWP